MEAILRKGPKTIQENKQPSIGRPRQMYIYPNQHRTDYVDDIQVHYGLGKPHLLSYPQWAKIYTWPGEELHLRYEVDPNSQNQELKFKIQSFDRIKIKSLNVKNYLCYMFCHIYPEYANQIIYYLNNVTFQKIAGKNLDKNMAYFVENPPGHLTVYYSSDLSCYKKVPNMEENFNKNSAMNPFMAVMAHEFGHLIQDKILGYKKNELGEALHEHHNVLFHENMYPGRNRGVYNKFEPGEFDKYFNKGIWFVKSSAVNERKKYILNLQNPASVDTNTFVSIIEAFKSEINLLKQNATTNSQIKMNTQQPLAQHPAQILNSSHKVTTTSPVPPPPSSLLSPPPPPPPPPQRSPQSPPQQQPISSQKPSITKNIRPLTYLDLKQINVFLEIMNELSKKPKDEIKTSDTDFLRSLLVSLMENNDSYKWYQNMFVGVMSKIFPNIPNATNINTTNWYQNLTTVEQTKE